MTSTALPAFHMNFRDWASLRYHLLWAYEGKVHPSALNLTTTDPDTSCWLLRKGEVELTTKGKRTCIRANQWVFVASPTRHQIFSEDAEILSLHFHLSWPGNLPVFEQESNQVLEARDHPALERTAKPLVRQLRRIFPGANAHLPILPCTLEPFFRVQNLLPLWLIAYQEAQARLGVTPRRLKITDDRILQAASDLDHQPLHEPFSEESLSARIGLGHAQLNALFTKFLGLTPAKYFERRRLEESKSMLRQTNTSIKEIAFTLGFRHESHFSMWFRRMQRQTPTAFRRGVEPV